MSEQKIEMPVHIDVGRMKKALAGPFYMVPQGLTSEQAVEFFNTVAKVAEDATLAERERCASAIQSEIDRAEALLNLEEAGNPVFDRAQTEAGICALLTVLAAIRGHSVTETPPAPSA